MDVFGSLPFKLLFQTIPHFLKLMKGTIHRCLAEMVTAQHGEDKWRQCLMKANLRPSTRFHMRDDLDEAWSMGFFQQTALSLDIGLPQLLEDFGRYWCCVYAPREYEYFFFGMSTAKRMLFNLDRLHENIRKHFHNAQPPFYGYEWLDDEQRRLKVTYTSDRGLMDLYIFLVKGLGEYYNETIGIEKLSEKEVILEFEYPYGLTFGRSPLGL
jgi:hypothetical protein